MQRRHFIKFAAGMAAGVTLLAANAMAAPLPPVSSPPSVAVSHNESIDPAVVTQNDVDHLKPEQVWWHRRYWHRHWGWRRPWGWHPRWRWHRWHHWHRRYW